MKTPRIYLADLPASVNGCAAPDAEDGYIILINSALDDYNKKRVLLHELAHIMRGDFNGSDPNSAEAETHELIAGMQIADPWNATRRATSHRDAR